MTGHDPVCTVKPTEAIKAADCWRCKLIAQARADERKLCIEIAVKAAGQHPTLGQQRMLRELRGES